MHASKFVESYFDAWNHYDPVAVANHLAAEGTYCDIPEHRRSSHDELVETLTEFFANDRHRYELIGDILEGPGTLAFQYRICPLVGHRESDTAGIFRGAEFITLNGDAAMTIYDYYDVPGATQRGGIAGLVGRPHRARKYAKSGLGSEQLAQYGQQLEYVMTSQRLYQRPDLTLPELAEAVGCSVNHLSQVINAGFSMSFFEYVNRYRIDFAKRLLASLDSQDSAILNIAFSVGFNSNSAFYAAFKKYVGETPAQYRRAMTPDSC